MSVVAMYFDKKARTVYAASDGITISGYSMTSQDSIKLHKGKRCIIGSCGSTFLGQVFPRHLTKVIDLCVKKAKGREHFGEMMADILAGDPQWHEFSMRTQQRSPGSFVHMLIGCRYGLYKAAAPSYDFARVSYPYYAIGAGASFSIGALHNWNSTDDETGPATAVKSAVAAACSGSMAVTGKIRLETMKV